MPPLVLLDRRRRADAYPWLVWKVRLFVVGACLAAGGMAMEIDWLVLVATVVLGVGFLLRFMPGGRGEVEDEEGEEGEEIDPR